MKSGKRAAGLLALAVPFVVMALLVGMNVQKLSHAEYRFAIEGYDPRDLLRGHFLIFRYKWDEIAQGDECGAKGENCCACIGGMPDSPTVRFAACDTVETGAMCKGVIPVAGGRSTNYQPEENLRQYYIPEAHAPMLEKLLRGGEKKFEVGLVPAPRGGGQLKMMYVDGVPLPEFLANLPPQ